MNILIIDTTWAFFFYLRCTVGRNHTKVGQMCFVLKLLWRYTLRNNFPLQATKFHENLSKSEKISYTDKVRGLHHFVLLRSIERALNITSIQSSTFFDTGSNECSSNIFSSTDEVKVVDRRQAKLFHMGYLYHKSGPVRRGVVYYRCSKMRLLKCKATLSLNSSTGVIRLGAQHQHNHPPTPAAGQRQNVGPVLTDEDPFQGKKMMYQGFYFYRNGASERRLYWRCANSNTLGCNMRLHTDRQGQMVEVKHQHLPHCEAFALHGLAN